MAGVTNRPRVREQFAAILRMRWLVFLHSLRTTQGKMELLSRIFLGGVAVIAGLGGMFGFGAGAFYFSSHNQFERLALLLWPVMLIWQLFPVVSTTFSGSVDSTNLVRFPLSYRSYFLIQLIEGFLGPSSLVPCLWLLGMTTGIALGNMAMLPVAVAVLTAFGVVNLLLSRMVMSWVERWMAQRRTREIFGLVFFLLMMSIQFIGPTIERLDGVTEKHKQDTVRILQQVSSVQKVLPPGSTAEALAGVAKHEFGASAFYFSLLCGCGAAFGWLLGARLRKQYRGESLSEVEHKRESKAGQGSKAGWDVFGCPGPVAAMFEKEIRYLSRSGQMLLALLSPLFIVVLFRFQGEHGNPFMRTSTRAFQVGAAFAVMSTMNMFQNSFGGDGGGVQLLYAAPVRFRDVILGKNLAHAMVGIVEIAAVATLLAFFGLIPSIGVVSSTLVAVVFAIVSLATVGNLLSLYVPKKVDFGKFNRQQGSPVAVVGSMLGIFGIFGVAALVLYVAPILGSIWISTAVMSFFAVLAIIAYFIVLGRVDEIAMLRREKLLQEVCRA